MVSIAAQVFVCQPPFKAPTGRLLGTAHFQRLLREPPSHRAAPLREQRPGGAARRHRPRRRRAARPATTCSPSPSATPTGQLLGAVTVDDVLDRQLGTAWRQRPQRRTVRRPTRAPDEGRRRGEAPRRPQRAAGDVAALGFGYDAGGVRPLLRVDRPLPRHRPLPRLPDRGHRRLAAWNTLAPGQLAVRPVGPRLRAAHPACCRCRRPTRRR